MNGMTVHVDLRLTNRTRGLRLDIAACDLCEAFSTVLAGSLLTRVLVVAPYVRCNGETQLADKVLPRTCES